MSRALGTNLTNDADAKVTTPRYLIEIATGGTLRHATGGNASGSDISWGGNTYTKTNVVVSGLRWQAGGVSQFTLTYVLPPNLVATFTGITPSTGIKLYMTAALSSYSGSNDVVELFDGETNGGWSLNQHVFTLQVVRTSAWFPPYFGRPNDGFNDLTLPGVYQIDQVPVVLERGYA